MTNAINTSSRVARRARNGCGLLLALSVTLASTGCMMTPEDGQHIGKLTNPVDFSGVSGYPNEWIAIQAWNSDIVDWQTVAWTKTDGAAMAGSDGELFEWSKSFVVPEDNWIPWGFNTLKAEVRAVVSSTDEICHASSGEPYATIWANYPPPTIEDGMDLKTR